MAFIALFVTALSMFAVVYLGQEAVAFDICSPLTICSTGLHCCSATACCTDNSDCCEDGQACCSSTQGLTSVAPTTPANYNLQPNFTRRFSQEERRKCNFTQILNDYNNTKRDDYCFRLLQLVLT